MPFPPNILFLHKAQANMLGSILILQIILFEQ
jgi:hypothetical protein